MEKFKPMTLSQNPFEAISIQIAQLQEKLDSLYNKVESATPKPINQAERLTRKQVSKEYKISLGTIHNLMKSGKLQYEKIGRKTLFKRIELEACFSQSKRGK
jgi:excisionase family DNA binding protein